MTTKLKPAFLHKKSEDPNMIRFSYLVLLKRKNVPEQNGSSGKTAVGLVLGAMKTALMVDLLLTSWHIIILQQLVALGALA